MGERNIGTNLFELAGQIRTGTANPFILGVDLCFDTKDKYERVKASGVVNAKTVSKLYHMREEDISIMYLDNGFAIKVTWPYVPPGANPGCRDAYGCQQHIPLMMLKIP